MPARKTSDQSNRFGFAAAGSEFSVGFARTCIPQAGQDPTPSRTDAPHFVQNIKILLIVIALVRSDH
jgi:hypothetical protein